MAKNISPEQPVVGGRPRGGRALHVIAWVLFVALMVGAGSLVVLVEDAPDPQPGEGVRQEVTLTDLEAPPEPVDERAADLALDPERETEWRYQTNGEKIVYLTFDDGPSANTPKVLDILDRYDAKATFFVTGHEPEYRSSIKDAYERGHSIGLHTMTHDYASVYASVDAYFSDLEQVGEVVKEQIGYVPYLVRFPGGASNTVSANYSRGIMSTLVEEVPARGYQFYDWNVSSSDASGNNVSADKIVASSCVEGYSNIMLLFHDAAAKSTTVEALPRIIEYYQERGYTFAAIDRSAFVCHHGVNN